MKIVLTVVVVLLVGGVAGIFLAGPKLMKLASSFKPQAITTEVRTQEIAPGTLIETISAPGEIEPHTNIDLSAEVSARIEELPFEEGDAVRQGDLVVKLDDRDLRAALESATARRDGEKHRLESEGARLIGLQSTLAFARKELERKQSLFETGDVSRQDLDNALERVQELESNVNAAKSTISVIESSLAASEADIRRAEEGLNKTIITSPIDGEITALNAEIGEIVLVGTMNNPGTVIMTIADRSRMILNAQVSESDIAKIAEGQPARIHVNAYRDEEFSGVVTRIALQRAGVADGTGFFETEVEIDLQGKRIYSGLIANVDIEIARHEGLVVESQAIQHMNVEELPDEIRQDNPLVDSARRTVPVVYRLVDGKAVCTPVKIGASDLTHTLILEGLAAGDRVVIGPYKVLENIKHDDRLKDQAQATPDAAGETTASADDQPEDDEAADPSPPSSQAGEAPDDDGSAQPEAVAAGPGR